jgi:Ran GTPase-activating protein (RanGAP) involved in mRNA processing and transport
LYSSTLTKLIHLLFRGSEVGDRGVVEIVKSGILKRLEVLDLKDGTITDEGARVLAECPDARRLKRLNLEGNAPLTTDGVARLKAAGINVSATPRQT